MISYEPIEVLFQVGSFKVYSWGFIFVVAFLISFFLILRQAKKQNINKKHIYNLAIIILVWTIVGTRIVYVLEHASFFLENPLEILLTWQGGLTSYGAFLALLFAWFYIKKQKDITLSQILNLLAPYIVLAIAIIRIGCFLRGCCEGQPSLLPWAVNGKHPTQLYESLYSFIIFIVLLKFRNLKENTKAKKTRFKILLEKQGSLFLFFLLFYSFFRFLNDFLRFYETYWLGLALSQWISLFLFLVSILFTTRIQNSSPQPINRQ